MASSTALLVGGTGPTGPHLLTGLRRRGYAVTVFHRGLHEAADVRPDPDVEHLHADPHFAETIRAALDGREFDVVLATYGRVRHLADALAGRCGAFLAVSGAPAYAGFMDPQAVWPSGLPLGADESSPGADETEAPPRLARTVRASERHVLDLHADGALSATLFRYTSIYGPRQVYPTEWSVVRRCRDRRPFVILPDGGLTIETRCAAANAAEIVLRALDRPEVAAGQIFNVADTRQYSLRQWVEAIVHFSGGALRIESLPFELAGPGRDLMPLGHNQHVLMTAGKARTLLGHRDVVAPLDALRQTVEWYLSNPPSAASCAVLKDRFDYAAEDAWVARFRAGTTALATAAAGKFVHAYAHPSVPIATGAS